MFQEENIKTYFLTCQAKRITNLFVGKRGIFLELEFSTFWLITSTLN